MTFVQNVHSGHHAQTLGYALHALAQTDQLDPGTMDQLLNNPQNALQIASYQGADRNANEGIQAYKAMADVSSTMAVLARKIPLFQQLPFDLRAAIVKQAAIMKTRIMFKIRVVNMINYL